MLKRKNRLDLVDTLQAMRRRRNAIAVLLSDIERLPPALGRRWQKGMLTYYRGVLEEMDIEIEDVLVELKETGQWTTPQSPSTPS